MTKILEHLKFITSPDFFAATVILDSDFYTGTNRDWEIGFGANLNR